MAEKSLSVRCPLLMQGMLANPAFLASDDTTRNALLSTCKCIQSKCGFWVTLPDEEDDGAVEGCGIALGPAQASDLAGALDALGEGLGEAQEALVEQLSGVRKVLDLAAIVAAQKFEIDLPGLMQQAQALGGEGEEEEEEEGDDEE